MRILSIAAGAFMIISGIWCLANPGAAFGSLVLLISVLMMISGICSVIAYVRGKKAFGVSGWLLADGILSIILAVAMLADLGKSEVVLMVFFGMWLLFAGMLRAMTALALKKLNAPGWGWMMGAGALCAVTGFCVFASPLAAGFALMSVIGVLLLMQGVCIIVNGYFVGKVRDMFR